jgi:signal transduction histidine kinase
MAALAPSSWSAGLAAGPALAALVMTLRQGTPARRRRWGAAAVLLQAAFLYGCLAGAAVEKGRILAGEFIKDSVASLESWARFLLTDSLPEVDRSRKAILTLLRSGATGSTLAADIWSRTLPARFNWYSSLEIQGPDGVPRSRFSLNIPKILRPAAAAPVGGDWTINAVSVPLMGRERRFLTAARDWIEGGETAGRVALSLSLDPDMLPFLYSANPYFELLRVDTIPSLSGFDIRFAVFDAQGRILFNPFRISSGMPAPSFSAEGRWSRWHDGGRPYDLFGFLSGDRKYAAFLPRRTWRSHVVNLARTLALALAILAPGLAAAAWAAARSRSRRFLWSFAGRVFLSFLAVALIPILLFAVFSGSFFNRLFTGQFEEKAALHADMARGVMDDFLFLEEGGAAGENLPPEDLVLWISNTIGNDVNLYRDGRLIASSRRELFDAGILPEILDGEVSFQLRHGSDPTVASVTRLGTYSLRTLTVPYESPGGRLALSLPFPFESRDIASASQELTEFLVFMAVFILGLVPLVARGVGGRLVEPVRRLLAGTREASLGNLEFAIDYDGRDEMKTLVEGFNAMIRGLKEHQQELAELGQKAAWAEMARKVAHEIKNPLTPIQLSAEHILRVYEDGRQDLGPALKESISYIVGEVENLRRIALEFLDVSREAVARKERIPIDALVRETVEPYRRLLADRIEIAEEYPSGGPAEVLGDRAKLKIALRNLLTNAIESIHGRGRIWTRVETAGAEVLVRVDDTGSGMEPEVRDRVFEPYFSTKDAGTGLGLPISKKIVEDHGGGIRIESAPGQGTRVWIRLPAAPAGDASPSTA